MTGIAVSRHPEAGGAGDFAAAMDRELEAFERELAGVEAGHGVVGEAVDGFLARPGKRLRPRCLLLAASVGGDPGPAARRLALAAELVHSATLLHDDVIDESPERRGAATVSAELGNPVAILAGDWLLMKGLELVRQAAVPETLAGLIGVVSEMIVAESRQLETRRDEPADRASYLRVARRKTAGLFQWSLEAGGRAGGLTPAQCEALSRVGLHLGVGFQIADDLADLVGAPDVAEGGLYGDLRLGLPTYPLVLALERQPRLARLIESVTDEDPAAPPSPNCRRIVAEMRRLGAVDDTRRAVSRHRARALDALRTLPERPAVAALSAVVERALGVGRGPEAARNTAP